MGTSATAAFALLFVSAAQVMAAAPEPQTQIRLDLDGDGMVDRASAHMRPHSMRLDVEIVLAKQTNRTIDVLAVQQPPTGPLVYAKLRPAPAGRFNYACKRVENRDAEPCLAGAVETSVNAIEVITPGQPDLLIWLEDGKPQVVRLAERTTATTRPQAHVLFVVSAPAGMPVLKRSEQLRDSLALSWLVKGVPQLSPRWFQRCPHAGNLNAIEACVRPIWSVRQAQQDDRVVIVLAARRGPHSIIWRCLGSRSSYTAIIGGGHPSSKADAIAARRCLTAVVTDLPPSKLEA